MSTSPMLTEKALKAATDAWLSVNANTFNFDGGIPTALSAFLSTQDREALAKLTRRAYVDSCNDERVQGDTLGAAMRSVVDALLGSAHKAGEEK